MQCSQFLKFALKFHRTASAKLSILEDSEASNYIPCPHVLQPVPLLTREKVIAADTQATGNKVQIYIYIYILNKTGTALLSMKKHMQVRNRSSPWSANEKAFLQCFAEGGRFPCPNRSACAEKRRKKISQKEVKCSDFIAYDQQADRGDLSFLHQKHIKKKKEFQMCVKLKRGK